MGKIKSTLAVLTLCAAAAALPVNAVLATEETPASAGDDITTIDDYFNDMSGDQRYQFMTSIRGSELDKMMASGKIDEAGCVLYKFVDKADGTPGEGLVFMLQILEMTKREGKLDYDAGKIIKFVMVTLFKQCVIELQGYEKGFIAYESRDYAKALHEWRPLANQGHANSQTGLGVLYNGGQGVPQDYAEARKWFLKAAEQDHAIAQTHLGHLYHYGNGVRQDYAKARKWYLKAAEQGHAGALHNLGFFYKYGQGVPQNFTEARNWYLKAAEQGYAGAMYELGLMYNKGQGVAQDYIRTYIWWDIAASKGDEDAVVGRTAVQDVMTPAQIKKAQQLSRECVAKKYKNC